MRTFARTKQLEYTLQLKKLQEYIAAYAEWLSTDESHGRLPFWETQRNWRTHFDLEAPVMRAGYEAGLHNDSNRRVYRREAFDPKSIMVIFMEREPEFVRSAFQDLFNNEKEPLMRAERFAFYCDQLWLQLRNTPALKRRHNHDHGDDLYIISLYLSLQFPELYAPYRANQLRPLLEKLGATQLPAAGDYNRHVKLMRTFQNFLQKEPELLERHAARLDERHYAEESLLLAYDFGRFILG